MQGFLLFSAFRDVLQFLELFRSILRTTFLFRRGSTSLLSPEIYVDSIFELYAMRQAVFRFYTLNQNHAFPFFRGCPDIYVLNHEQLARIRRGYCIRKDKGLGR